MIMRGLVLVALLSLQSLALDVDDIEIMRDNGVKIAFPNERKAHTISHSTRPADLMRVNYIKLNGQSLRKIPKWLPKMTNIVKLELQDTNMDLIDLFALKSLSNLNTLDLSNNKNLFDKGGSLSELLSHFSLSELYLANTGGSSSNYANIGNSKSLIKLDLSDNSISSINSLHLERLQNLKSLKIVANRISGTLNTAYLPKRSLVYLNLSHNNISRLTFSDDFPALESLHISMNDSYLEFDEDWDDAYILKRLSDGSFNEDIELPKSIMKRLRLQVKFFTPTEKICGKNGGKYVLISCEANWENAKNICIKNGGVLASIKQFENAVETCKGIWKTSISNNTSYETVGDFFTSNQDIKNKQRQKKYLECIGNNFSSISWRFWSRSEQNSEIAYMGQMYIGARVPKFKNKNYNVICTKIEE